MAFSTRTIVQTMSQPSKRTCCGFCCSTTITLGLTALFLWLSLRVSKPKCSLQNLYIPALNKTLNSTTNTTLFFHLKLENTNKEKGVYYDPINVTFFDGPNKSHFIATYTIPPFYQGHKKKAVKGPPSGIPTDLEAVSRAVFANGTAVFRVDMATSVRYKIFFWKTEKRHRIKLGGNVLINDQGMIKADPKKGVKLSGSSITGGYFGQIGIPLINSLGLVVLHL